MSINPSNKAFRTIPHPRIYDVRAKVLHASGCKSMSQEILRHLFILHHSFEDAIQGIQGAVTFNRFVDVDVPLFTVVVVVAVPRLPVAGEVVVVVPLP